MLAKARASVIHSKLVPLIHKRCVSGSVMILEDNAIAKHGKSAKLRKARLSGGIYVVPQEYSTLLEQLKCGKIGSTEDVDAEQTGQEVPDGVQTQQIFEQKPQSSEQDLRRAFWAGAREVARQRIKNKEPDLSAAEVRVAKLHESLWVEELRMTLELQGLRSRVDEIKPRGNGLFTLDISEMYDEFSHSLGQFLQRGVQVQISNDQDTCLAFVQPGSDSGKLLVSSESLEDMRGPYEIEFLPNRFPQRAMHRALDCERVRKVLSELQRSEEDAEKDAGRRDGSGHLGSTENTELKEHTEPTVCSARVDSNKQIEVVLPPSLNSVQRRALSEAIGRAGNPFPLLVWGPPGTGKTTLAAFLVWHLVQANLKFQLLVTAPSNTGADVLCAKLAKPGLDESRMLRLNALGRNVKTVPEEIQRYGSTTQRDGRSVFQIPQLSKLRSFRVVVTTCICASHIANTARKERASGWFSHVIVDEAGEATEPETLVPMQLLSPSAHTQIILFGDHFQLGPLVISSLARRIAKLNESMIERLVNLRFQAAKAKGWSDEDGHRQDRQDRQGLTRDTLTICESKGLFFLTESFRSHPDIMEIYSKVFYAGQLEHRDREIQHRLMPFFHSLGSDNPVVLHNVVGAERCDANSASLYNLEEIRVIQRYVQDLLDARGEDSEPLLSPKDIGIITPYARQVQLLKDQICAVSFQFSEIDVGTVEHFQGQERRVIIFSTVRSSQHAKEREEGVRRPIGFLSDRTRINVAVSRAVAGLVIVGDFEHLSRYSSEWKEIFSLGKDRGFLRGEPIMETQMQVPPEAVVAAVAPAEVLKAWDSLTA